MLNITADTIKKAIDNSQSERAKAIRFYELYKGNHTILQKKVSSPKKPSNKIINPFYAQIVDTAVGYFVGKPIVISHNISQDFQDAMDAIFMESDKDDLFGEVAKEASIKGKSYILTYQNELRETKLAKIPAEEMVIKRSSTGAMLYAIRHYGLTDEDNNTTYYAEVYTDKTITYYVKDGASGEYRLMIRPEPLTNPSTHIFQNVPIVEFLNNSEAMSDLELVQSLVEMYDKVESFQGDEIEAFRNAYFTVRNMIMSEDTFAQLKEEGILELGEDGEASFLVKPSSGDTIENFLSRIAKSIHKFSQIPDLSDENFGGNLSGVAIRFKILGLENKTIMKERKFTKAIRELLKLMAIPIKIETGEDLKLIDIDIQYSRNLPNNLQEIVDMVVKLNGVVDTETLLSLLPFVTDPSAILEKIRVEQEEGMTYPNSHSSSVDSQDNQITA